MSACRRFLMSALVLLLAPEMAIGAEAKSPDAPAEPQDSDAPADSQVRPIDTIVVVASPPESDLPGSGIFLDEDAIRKHSYADINRVLARVPGVYLRQEEGYGLFPNISLRGVDSLRSTKVTLMEDRVPSVPAPYSAPASYYAPNIGRMRGIEVLKGSSQVRYGPHTTGGVINYLSTAIPGRRAIYVNALYGSQNEIRAHANAGDTLDTPVGEVGYLLEGYFGQTDGFKKIDRKPGISSAMADETGFLRIEPMLKLAWEPDTEVHQRLEAKLGYTHLDADETYLGLSDADFEGDPFRRYAASRFANMEYDHWRTYLRHSIEPTEDLSLVTTAYYGKFDRNWFKSLEVGDETGFEGLSEALAAGGNHLKVLRGEASGTLRYRNNNRHYYVAGVDHMTSYEMELAPGRHTWTAGARYHRDRSKRFQTDEWFEQNDDGAIIAHTVGDAGGGGNWVQESQALALFLEDKIEFDGLGLALTLGGRFEQVWQDYDDRNAPAPKASEDYAVAAGGVGATYAFDENWRLFGGLYRGYSVPDPRGAVARGLVPETSVNLEAGLRYALPERAFKSEGTFFFSHFDDLIVESVVRGEATTTDNVGEVDSLGVELSCEYDPGLAFDWPVLTPWFASFTYTHAVLANDTQSIEPESIFSNGRKGNEVPYVPEFQFSIGSGVEYGLLGIALIASYVDEMYTSASNTSQQVRFDKDGNAVPDARFGKTDPYFVVDLAAHCQIHEHVRLKLSVHNLLDREQMVSRHPEGPRPGPPLTVLGGLEAAF